MLVDYHTHLLGHLDRRITAENVEEFLQAAKESQIQEFGVSDHERYQEEFDFELVKEVADQISGLSVKAGVEMNYMPGEGE
jgi:histidinol-phosphatase (PHP family)